VKVSGGATSNSFSKGPRTEEMRDEHDGSARHAAERRRPFDRDGGD
jgi:hypothetical protein